MMQVEELKLTEKAMGHKRNEYEKKKLNKKFKGKKRKEKNEKNKDILLQRMQQFNGLCLSDN